MNLQCIKPDKPEEMSLKNKLSERLETLGSRPIGLSRGVNEH